MKYEQIELGQPGRPACPDKFTFDPAESSTRLVQGSKRLLLQISEQAVVIQLGTMRTSGQGTSFGSIVWQAEETFLPMIAAIAREFDAIRVRNYTPGAPAQVLIGFD